MQEVILDATDGYKLCLHVFVVQNAKAVIQLVHGMEEHQERYEPFIEFLNSNGFSVVSSDMRGHGKNAPTLGFFANKGGHKLLVADQMLITNYIKSQFASLPIYIFAHSMGTIITRVLLQNNSQNYSKVVLSGYPCWQLATSFGIFVCNVAKTFRGAKGKSKLIDKLSVGAFNKKIKNPQTNVDWISANEQNIQNYLADPLCGVGFTCSAFGDLFKLVRLMHKPKLYKNVNSSLQLLLLRGQDDPCVGGEKGATDSKRVLAKAGFKDILANSYPNMRHEILNEVENQIVYQDVLEFFVNKK